MFYQRHPSGFFVFFVLALASLSLLIPLALLDHVRLFGGTDSLFYLSLLGMNGRQFLAGDVWPGWLMDANVGIGFPLMYYYPPLPYLLTTVLTLPLRWLGAGMLTQFMAGIVLSQAFAGLAAWVWLKQRFNARAAVFGALFYMLLPYKLVMIYLHMNLAAAWAVAALPVILLACEIMPRQRIRGMALFALGAAFVGYCHPLTLAVFLPFAAVYALYAGGRASIIPLLAGLVLTVFLTAAYTLPFLGAKEWLVADAFLAGKFNALANLGHIDTLLCVYYLLIAALALLLLSRIRRSLRTEQRSMPVFWAVALVLFYALTLSISAPLWQHITPLKLLQFPFARLHAVIGIAACWLVAWLVERAGHPAAPFYCRLPVLFLVLLAAYAGAGVQIARVYRQPTHLTQEYVADMRATNIIPYDGYYTRWGGYEGSAMYKIRDKLLLSAAASVKGKGTAQVTCWEPGKICVKVTLEDDNDALYIRQAYIPVWQAYKGTAQLKTEPAGVMGNIRIPLPRGEHEVRLVLAPLPHQSLADIVSLLSLLGCSALLMRRRRTA